MAARPLLATSTCMISIPVSDLGSFSFLRIDPQKCLCHTLGKDTADSHVRPENAVPGSRCARCASRHAACHALRSSGRARHSGGQNHSNAVVARVKTRFADLSVSFPTRYSPAELGWFERQAYRRNCDLVKASPGLCDQPTTYLYLGSIFNSKYHKTTPLSSRRPR